MLAVMTAAVACDLSLDAEPYRVSALPRPIRALDPKQEMKLFFGNLHSHSGASDGEGTPDEAFRWAREVAGYDFYAITDHAEGISEDEWRAMGAAARAHTVDGEFVGLRGFEWSNFSFGHVNVYGTRGYVGMDDIHDPDAFYAWIDRRGGLAQFNHPGRVGNAFQGLGYKQSVADNFFAIETGNKSHSNSDGIMLRYLPLALYRGWRVAPTNNQDNHKLRTNRRRTVILAPELTRAALLEAMRARRLYSTDDPNLELRFKHGARWMGEQVVVRRGTAQLDVRVDDDEPILRIELRDRGGEVVARYDAKGRTAVRTSFRVELTRHDCFYVTVHEKDTRGDDPHHPEQIAVSAPIWLFVQP